MCKNFTLGDWLDVNELQVVGFMWKYTVGDNDGFSAILRGKLIFFNEKIMCFLFWHLRCYWEMFLISLQDGLFNF